MRQPRSACEIQSPVTMMMISIGTNTTFIDFAVGNKNNSRTIGKVNVQIKYRSIAEHFFIS
jgi:hypothetical protein